MELKGSIGLINAFFVGAGIGLGAYAGWFAGRFLDGLAETFYDMFFTYRERRSDKDPENRLSPESAAPPVRQHETLDAEAKRRSKEYQVDIVEAIRNFRRDAAGNGVR